MLWMITKFIFCLIVAGAFGFILGWVLSSLIRNEKLEEKYTLLKDDFDTQKAELNQSFSDIELKEDELDMLEKRYQQSQKELLIKNMDIEEYEIKGLSIKSSTELELENNTLKEEISEYKYLENENNILHSELKALEEEKEQLLLKLEDGDILMLPQSVKNESKNRKNKLLKKHLKIARAQLKLMKNELSK